MYLILINLFDKSGQFASNDSEVYYFVLLLDGLQISLLQLLIC